MLRYSTALLTATITNSPSISEWIPNFTRQGTRITYNHSGKLRIVSHPHLKTTVIKHKRLGENQVQEWIMGIR